MKILITCIPMINNIKRYLIYSQKKKLKFFYPPISEISNNYLKQNLHKYDGWIAGDDEVNEDILINSKPNLKVIIKWGIGIDNFDINLLKKYKIKFSNTPNIFAEDVSNLAICYMLGISSNAFKIHYQIKKKNNWYKPTGSSVKNKTIGILGYGNIGRCLAQKLKLFSNKIIVWDPGVKKIEEKKLQLIKSWPSQIQKCNYVILTCSLNKSNFHLINSKIFGRLKRDVGLVNVSRGKLINEKDLIKFLKTNKGSNAALDVFENEPISLNSPLRSLNNVILGSHNASNTLEGVDEASMKSINKMYKLLKI